MMCIALTLPKCSGNGKYHTITVTIILILVIRLNPDNWVITVLSNQENDLGKSLNLSILHSSDLCDDAQSRGGRAAVPQSSWTAGGIF